VTALDWTPAREPARATIQGSRVRLEPLDRAAHGDDLWAVSRADGDARLWQHLPYGPFEGDRTGFDGYLADMAATADPLAFAVVDAESGRAGGIVTYLRIAPQHGVIEIGHIWFGHTLQRTPHATEAIYLLARTAFDELGNRRLEWKCDAANERSKAAALRFGFTYEGTFRQHQIVKRRNRDTAWFAILDGDWPAIRRAFEAWLDPANFDGEGRQCSPLEARRR
jgi:RimJ/RimL family protein N-acetyltransferase